MKIWLNHILLLVLFFVFVILYVYVSDLSDIWSNLLAAIVTVFLIDTIVRAAEKSKFKTSEDYVESRILSICADIISSMAPPNQWQQKLTTEQVWDDYYDDNLLKTRDRAVERFERTIDTYQNLLNLKLLNQICTLLKMLTDRSWRLFEFSLGPEFRDGHEGALHLEVLLCASNLADQIIASCMEIIEKNGLTKEDNIELLKTFVTQSSEFKTAVLLKKTTYPI